MNLIVNNLSKNYKVPVRDSGLASALKSIIKPVYNEVKAVENVNFEVDSGEVVGFIGPNGAGKTTTLKMLSGLMHPTGGTVKAGGFTPWERKPDYLKRISMLMGNKSQLTWDNTVLDSFEILRDIYGVSQKSYQNRLEELVSLLEIEGLLKNLARNLSLGERARCEFAAALLHNPEVIFLDEPTLGLDVSMQLKLRSFIKDYNKRMGPTIILTSHYMSDITTLCNRVILIHEGRILFDGALDVLSSKMAPFKLIKVSLLDEPEIERVPRDLLGLGEVIESEKLDLTIRTRKEEALRVTNLLMNSYRLSDLSIADPPIDAVIDQIYRGGLGA